MSVSWCSMVGRIRRLFALEKARNERCSAALLSRGFNTPRQYSEIHEESANRESLHVFVSVHHVLVLFLALGFLMIFQPPQQELSDEEIAAVLRQAIVS